MAGRAQTGKALVFRIRRSVHILWRLSRPTRLVSWELLFSCRLPPTLVKAGLLLSLRSVPTVVKFLNPFRSVISAPETVKLLRELVQPGGIDLGLGQEGYIKQWALGLSELGQGHEQKKVRPTTSGLGQSAKAVENLLSSLAEKRVS